MASIIQAIACPAAQRKTFTIKRAMSAFGVFVVDITTKTPRIITILIKRRLASRKMNTKGMIFFG